MADDKSVEARGEARRTWRIRMFALCSAVLLGLVLLPHLAAILPVGTPTCLFRYLTGAECPGCGITRSISAAFCLRFRDAFALHPAGPAVGVVVLSLAGYLGWMAFTKPRSEADWRTEARAYTLIGLSLAVLIIAGWLGKALRN